MQRKRKNKRFKLNDKYISKLETPKENNNTFYKIIQNTIPGVKPFHIQENYEDYVKDNNNDFFNFEVSSFFNGITDEKGNLKNFYDIVIKNNYISSFSREKIIKVFSKVKRLYNALKVFENICYWKLSNKFENDGDLCMNPLAKFSKRSLIRINQNKTIYTFRISDLLKHINTNLLYTTNYFHEAKTTKNPYNNIELGLHDYYNIYFCAKASDYTIPPLVHLFFLENFNVKTFTVNHYPYIRDLYIASEYKTLSTNEKRKQIQKMLLRNKNLANFIIDPQFPDDILNEAMGHILLDYTYYRFTLNDQKLHECTVSYQKKLVNFSKYNKFFGRRKILRNPLKHRGYTVTFETKYPTLNELQSLCNGDDNIYDETLEINETTYSSDSDSSMSNELANNDNNRVHLNTDQNNNTPNTMNTTNTTNNHININNNDDIITTQYVDNSNNILSHNFRLLHRMHPNIIPTLPTLSFSGTGFYNADLSHNHIPRRELNNTQFNEIQYNEGISSILNTIDIQNIHDLNLNVLHDMIQTQYSDTIDLGENSYDSDDESITEHSIS